MNQAGIQMDATMQRISRASGDEPAAGVTLGLGEAYFPRERG